MPGEYNAGITEPFVSTVLVDRPRLGRVKMNTASYDPATCGEILEGPTVRPNTPGHANSPNKDPRVDGDGKRIADRPSPMLRA